MRIQHANALEKLHRNERHLKDKREANASMMERIRREFEQMDRERQENDRQVEELRAMADEVERNVRCCRYSVFPGWKSSNVICWNVDGGAYEAEPERARRAIDRILETPSCNRCVWAYP